MFFDKKSTGAGGAQPKIIKDHLGNIRVTVDESGSVVTTDDYYPFGMIMPGRSYNVAFSGNQYKFSSKELDDENGLDTYHFGWREYDPEIIRFNHPDRFQDKYPSLSPYVYAANNPLLFIDVNGDSVNLNTTITQDNANGTNFTNTLVNDLTSKTGLTLSTNNGKLEYAKDENGNPIIATDKDGNQIGSADARALLIGIISNTSSISVTTNPFAISQGNSANQVNLNPNQINSFISGASPGLDNTTMGWAMTFLHESIHTPIGGGISDGSNSSKRILGHTGGVVDKMNIIRAQLGSSFGQRTSYPAYPIGGSLYIPFDNSALNSLKRNLVPATKYIKH